ALGEFHQPHRLAIAFRPRHAEIVLDPAFCCRPLLLTDDAQAHAAEAAETAHDCRILTELAVASDWGEFTDDRVDVIEAVGPLRMTRHLGLLPRGEICIEGFERLRGACLEPLDFVADGNRIALGVKRAELLNLGLELGYRFFEVEVTAHQAS